MLSAPFLAAFGLRGLYVLPYLSLVATAVACVALGRACGFGRDSTTAAAAAILGTPFLFYGLEFWEHLPAVATATAGAAFFLRGHGFTAGCLLAFAVLLRPEAAGFAAALGLSARWLRAPLRDGLRAVAGLLFVLLPYEWYVFQHFGSFVPPHISANAAAAVDRGWLALRLELIATWFATAGKNSFWLTSPVAVMAVIAFVTRPLRYSGLMIVGAVTIALTVIAMPNTGGGQWGPRYLLLANIPFVIIAADVVDRLSEYRARVLVVAVALAGGFWLQRTAYRELRGTKGAYGAMVDVISATAGERPVVTDVWWLDQVAAAVFGDRPTLYAPEGSTGRNIVQRFSDAVVPAITVVRASAIGGDDVAWVNASCYVEEQRTASPGGELTLIQLRHRCRP